VPLLDTGVRLFVTDRDESAAGTTGATTSLQRIQSKFARNPRAQKLYKASASSLEQGGVLLDLRKQARALNIEVWPVERTLIARVSECRDLFCAIRRINM